MTDAVIGIDVGTYGSKGVLVDTEGTVLETRTAQHGLSTPAPGWAEHDADGVWWTDFCRLSQQLSAAAARQGLSVGAVAASAIGPTCLPVDADGRPLRPSILYGIDTRAEAEIAELEEELGAESVLDVCASPITSQAVGPKVRWLQRHEPHVWERTAKVLTAHSYLVARLTGRYVVDAYSAAAQVPFFDLEAVQWHTPFVEAVCPPDRLPEVVWSSDVAGEVTAAAAEQTGLERGTPVVAGTIDAAAEALGAGVGRPGDLMIQYGTTAFLIQTLAKPARSPNLWGGLWLEPGLSSITGGMSTSGAVTEWIRSQLCDLPDADAFSQLFAEADDSTLGAGGLLLLPYFSGERTPISDPGARGVVAGLSLSTTRGDLVRASLEATGLGVRHLIAAMRDAGADPARLIAIGGGTRSRTWLEIVSDATGLPQDVPDQRVGAAYGDALLALVATGAVSDVAAAADRIRVVDRVAPDARRAAFYDERFAQYLELYRATRPVIGRLAASPGARAAGDADTGGPGDAGAADEEEGTR